MKKALVQLHIAVFLAGFTAILGKWISLNEGVLVWYRIAITVAAMLLLFYVKKQLKRIQLKDAIKIIAVGGIVAFHWVTFYGSVKYANVSVALVCFSATGFFTALIEPIILKRKFDPFEMLLGFMAIIGIGIIFNFYPHYKTGIILGILSALGSACFPVYNKLFLQKHTPQTVMIYELSGGLIVLSLLLPLYLNLFPQGAYLPSGSDWIHLIILALLCTVFTFHLQLNSLKHISPFTANLTYNLEPVYGIIMAFIFFKENEYFGWKFYVGLIFILAAIVLQTYRVLKRKKEIY